MLKTRKLIPLFMLFITATILVGFILLSKQPSCTGKNTIPETAAFEWIGLPNGSYLGI